MAARECDMTEEEEVKVEEEVTGSLKFSSGAHLLHTATICPPPAQTWNKDKQDKPVHVSLRLTMRLVRMRNR